MSVRVMVGDCREQLRTLADESVHCVVTSPPYLGLRDYQVEGQIGLEQGPAEYVAELVGVFREVRRVLRADGVVWLNLGDSYAGSGRGGNPTADTSTLEGGQESQQASIVKRTAKMVSSAQREKCPPVRGSRLPAGLHEYARQAGAVGRAWVPPPAGFKQKDRMGIPHAVVFALRADGWYWRDEIVWAKPNPMPESVRDRTTKSHEFVFLLSKSERYYYDADAIAEPVTLSSVERMDQDVAGQAGSMRVPGKTNGAMKAVLRRDQMILSGRSPQSGIEAARRVARSGNKTRKPGTARGCPADSGSNVCGSVPWEGATRNKRSVWTVSTKPFKDAHFATFPPELIEPCILAGCPRGGGNARPIRRRRHHWAGRRASRPRQHPHRVEPGVRAHGA